MAVCFTTNSLICKQRLRIGLSQALQLLVAELEADQLCLGVVRELVGVVFDVVNIDGGHGKSPFINEKTPLPCELWGLDLLHPR